MSRSHPESGVSLVEIAVALTILSTVLVALGALMFQAGRHTRLSAAVTYRAAAATAAAAWVQALPWDSLDAAIGCTSDTVGQFPYTRCATVSAVSPALKRISVTITSTGPLAAATDTVTIDRNKPRFRSTLDVR